MPMHIIEQYIIYRETIKVPFEDTYARVPKDYDTYLKCLYGDYLRLPKEEIIEHAYNKNYIRCYK